MRSLWLAAILLLPAAGLSAQMWPDQPMRDAGAGAQIGADREARARQAPDRAVQALQILDSAGA